ncbi:MAG: hypothetical protein P4L27_13355 [Ignavibacteriaceae bacterium]|nr:hypothetical protein [Ignavibacteriaceae bacterium]
MNIVKWVILQILLDTAGLLNAQPYIIERGWDTIYSSNSLSPDLPSYDFNRINLANGRQDTLYLNDEFAKFDNTQSWLLVGSHAQFFAVNILDTNLSFGIPELFPYTVVYSASKHRLFVTGSQVPPRHVLSIINTVTDNEELRIGNLYGENIFLSNDEDKLFLCFFDTVFIPIEFNKIKVATISTLANRIIQTRNLQDLGYPGADAYSLSNGRKGIGIIGAWFNDNRIFYNIYDFETNASSPYFNAQGNNEPYYTNDGKYFIINSLEDSLSEDGMINYPHNTGIFKIYDVSSQQLIKTLQLPPRWEVYTFDNFPDNIYYYDDNTETAITLNIDSLVNNSPAISELAPAITFPGTQSFTLELKGSKFTSNSIVLWNGDERATTLVSDSILHATINPSDISSRGNSLVTVKTGYDISDTLMFTVVDSLTMPVHPILECVHNNGNNTYTAHFGYQNDLDKTVLVPICGQNSFSPGQTDRGQTTIFYPGRHTDVFTVEFDGSNISWILDMQVKSANSSSPPCN